ncbi:MAG: LysR family transcriptional regulator [Ruminococcaceae bacterium]|nr:LysR family transcriptional regulator [Oscillospiraceae bacterium]
MIIITLKLYKVGMDMFSNKDYVLEVYNEKSFSKASQNLYVSQPSLSASIRRIELKIGAPIFNRTTKPITLTDIGKEYIEKALQIKKIENEFSNYINDSLNIVKGNIKIGGSNLFVSYILPPIIAKFNKTYPGIEFTIYEDKTTSLISMLLDGEIDIFIDNVFIANENITSYFYISETILLAVPKDYKINSKLKKFKLSIDDIKNDVHLNKNFPCVSLDVFENEPFILLKKENDTGKKALLLCKRHGFTPKVVFEIDQQVTAHNISTSGLGISFVSDTLVKRTGEQNNIIYYKLSDEEIKRNIYFYTKSNHYIKNSTRKFIEENTN